MADEVSFSEGNPIRNSQFALIEMLRSYAPIVNKRAYPPSPVGVLVSSQLPRITVSNLTPGELRVGIGEKWGTGKGLWRLCNFKVDCWSKNPKECDQTADQVLNTIWKHRTYVPSTSTYGHFINLLVDGGTETTLNEAHQVYQKSVIVRGRWLEKHSNF